jgi:hypothetical protein
MAVALAITTTFIAARDRAKCQITNGARMFRRRRFHPRAAWLSAQRAMSPLGV